MRSLIALACGVAAFAQQPQGVVSGYTIDARSGSVRAILGIPGATRLGAPVGLPAKVTEGAFAQGRGVVASVETAQIYVLQNLGSANPQVVPLPLTARLVAGLYLNASATTALLYSGESSRLQFITNIDSTPAVASSIPVSLLKGAISAVSIAGSSGCALIATYDESGSRIQQLCPNGALSTVAQLPKTHVASLAWFPDGRGAAAVDIAGKQILWWTNLSENPAPSVFDGPSNGLLSPSAVLSLDDQTLAVTDSTSPNLFVIGTAGNGAVQSYPLAEIPTRLAALDSPGVLACTRLGSGPLLLVDTRHNFTSFFVPMN